MSIAAIIVGVMLWVSSGIAYLWMTVKTNQLKSADDQRDLFMQTPWKMFQIWAEYEKQVPGTVLPALSMIAFFVGLCICAVGFWTAH